MLYPVGRGHVEDTLKLNTDKYHRLVKTLRTELESLRTVNFRQAEKISSITGARNAFHNKLTLLLGGDVFDENFSVCEAIEKAEAQNRSLRDALERLYECAKLILSGKPCRDVPETFGEVEQALKEVEK